MQPRVFFPSGTDNFKSPTLPSKIERKNPAGVDVLELSSLFCTVH